MPADRGQHVLDRLATLQASARRLRAVVGELGTEQLDARAYPAEWTIADVLSHIGSGAVILQRRIDDAIAASETPAEFAPAVWDAWNAKSPAQKAADAVAADQALIDRLQAVGEAERDALRLSMGPLTLDFVELVGLRLNEHGIHTWDVQVALDPTATLPPDITAMLIDNLGLAARFSAKPDGEEASIHVHTTHPDRHFLVSLASKSVSLAAGDGGRAVDLTLTAEAFVRLVYGRLDAEHAGGAPSDASLDQLRRVFRGF